MRNQNHEIITWRIIWDSKILETTHKCPPIEEWMNKLWYMLKMEEHATEKKNSEEDMGT